MKILSDMIYEGESVFGIFSMIARQFKVIIQVRQLQLQGHSSKSIADRLKLHPFVVGKALKQTKNFSFFKLYTILIYFNILRLFLFTNICYNQV